MELYLYDPICLKRVERNTATMLRIKKGLLHWVEGIVNLYHPRRHLNPYVAPSPAVCEGLQFHRGTWIFKLLGHFKCSDKYSA